jgi:hexosaminidase
MTSRRRSASFALLLFLFLTVNIHAGTSGPVPRRSYSIRWRVLNNGLGTSPLCQSELALTNSGRSTLSRTGWALYFNFYQEIGPLPQTSTVRITRINGDFYRLEPASSFLPLEPGHTIAIPMNFALPIINASLAPSGFYFVFTGADGSPSQPLPVTHFEVGRFTDSNQTSRGKGDVLPTDSPQVRFAENRALTQLPLDQVGKVLPTPAYTQRLEGATRITSRTIVVCSPQLESEADYFVSVLQPLLGARLRIGVQDVSAGSIRLVLAKPTTGSLHEIDDEEGYRVEVAPRGQITISASTATGVFYGIQTLRALIPVKYYRLPHPSIRIDAGVIEDAPRFHHRGLTLDVARNFQSKQTIFKLLDAMAFYKLNKLQLHLADDEGWRLEIPGLPELTQVGGRRGHTLEEADRLIPSFGSGPSTDPAISHGSGYYSRADFIEILRYASRRKIDVIPEIESPGHARAAIKSMQARFRRLMRQGNAEDAQTYLLTDPDDKSSYESVQGWHDNVMNICMPSTFNFMRKVFKELVKMYAEAGSTLRVVHVGGDEVPQGAWMGSPACGIGAGTAITNHSAAQLRSNYFQQIDAILHEMGLIAATWEEGLIRPDSTGSLVPDLSFLDNHPLAYAWNNVWGEENMGTAYILANRGYDVIMAQASNLYFDMPYSKDPEEPGNYWAGFVDARQVYEFLPLNLYASERADLMGKLVHPCEAFREREQLEVSGKSHIVGLQGSLWAEHILGQSTMEYSLFPKLLALAERAWAQQPAWESDCNGLNSAAFARDWNEFSNQLGQRELRRLSYLNGGFQYRIPPPGAVIEKGILKANVSFPGLSIRYTTDGSEPNARSTRYVMPVAVAGTARLRTFDPMGRGSRTSIVQSRDN